MRRRSLIAQGPPCDPSTAHTLKTSAPQTKPRRILNAETWLKVEGGGA